MTVRASQLTLLAACLLLAGCGVTEYSSSQAPVIHAVSEQFHISFVILAGFRFVAGCVLVLVGGVFGYAIIKSNPPDGALVLSLAPLLGGVVLCIYALGSAYPRSIRLLTAEKTIVCSMNNSQFRIPYDKVKEARFSECTDGDDCRLVIEAVEGEKECRTHAGTIRKKDKPRLQEWFKKELGDRSKL